VLDAWREVLPSGLTRGQDALRQLPPKEFVEAASRIVPRELFLAVETAPGPFDGMSVQEMRDMLDTIKALRAKHIEQPSASQTADAPSH
jgi:hypothetical protein